MYYDGFYHYIYSWYMFSQNEGKAKEEKHLTKAGNYIWRMEFDHLKIIKDAEAKAEADYQKRLKAAKDKGQPTDNIEKMIPAPPTDTGWVLIGDRLRELMENAPKLKKEYANQKKAGGK
jgi:hypothetical protein